MLHALATQSERRHMECNTVLVTTDTSCFIYNIFLFCLFPERPLLFEEGVHWSLHVLSLFPPPLAGFARSSLGRLALRRAASQSHLRNPGLSQTQPAHQQTFIRPGVLRRPCTSASGIWCFRANLWPPQCGTMTHAMALALKWILMRL